MGLAERMNRDPLDVNSYVNIRDPREAYWPGFASRLKTRFIARGLFGNQDRRSGRKCRAETQGRLSVRGAWRERAGTSLSSRLPYR